MARVVAQSLRDHYSRQLLDQYYHELLIPNFGRYKDEIDPFEVFLGCFEDPEVQPDSMEIILLFDESDAERKFILGGCVCEFYANSHCGFLSYISIRPEFQGKGLAHRLVTGALEQNKRTAFEKGDEEAHALFLDTNSVKVDASTDVMDPKVRQSLLHKLGFRVLDFDFVLPALSERQGKCYDLVLACHHSYLVEGEWMDSHILQRFMRELFECLMGAETVQTDLDYLQLTALTQRERIGTVSPGTR
eukprot:m.79568 g.79568  ORF g.79568 m.79568 type:complete len:247 (+) comp50653_c0_seq4:146-886(+)